LVLNNLDFANNVTIAGISVNQAAQTVSFTISWIIPGMFPPQELH